MIKNYSLQEIYKSAQLKKNIFSIKHDGRDIIFYKGDFFMDGKMFFPFTDNFETSIDLFGYLMPKRYFEYFSLIKENFENIQEIDDAYIVGSGSDHNYYHNVIDFYSRLLFYKNFNNKKIILGETNLKNVITTMIDTLKIENKIVYVNDKFKKYKNSIFLINRFTDIVDFYDKYFSKKKIPKKLVYISRADSNNRKVINENQVINLLKSYNFEIVTLSDLSFLSQINLFNESKIIVTMHGASLTNLVFSPQEQTVLEMVPNFTKNKSNFYCDLSVSEFDDFVRKHFKNMAKIKKLNHFFLFCDYKSKKIEANKEQFTLTDIIVDIDLLNQIIQKIL